VLIDPFTVFVQVLNFVILILILKRFLFGPIMRAIAAREQKITDAQNEAKAHNEEAQQKLQEIEKHQAELTAQETEFLRQAKSRAEALETKLITGAKAAAKTKQEHLRAALEKETSRRLDDLRHELSAYVYNAADQALQDLAGQTLQQRMEECFFERLAQKGSRDDKEFSALFRPESSLTVSTAILMENQTRAYLKTLLANNFGFQGTLTFEKSPDLVSGIEISGNGRKITWTIKKYLKDFQNGLLDQEHSA